MERISLAVRSMVPSVEPTSGPGRTAIATSAEIPSGLIFADVAAPGISRKKLSRGWGYYRDGRRIVDRAEIDRLNALAVPPAYERCWFCHDPRGHIQAIGYDARGRRQYRYHPDFRTTKDTEKFARMEEFGLALPALRKALERDLARRAHDKTTMTAAVVRLLDIAQLRVGGQRYVQENGSFGATTLRKKHAKVNGRTLRLRFKAKSGKDADYVLSDRVLTRIVKRCQDLPGQSLFAWPDEDGVMHAISSHDVNDYLREVTGGPFTAKDFRTWGGTLVAYEALREAGPEGLKLKALLEKVSAALCNTPAVARKSYIHPALTEAASTGKVIDFPNMRATALLSRNERSLIAFLANLRETAPASG